MSAVTRSASKSKPVDNNVSNINNTQTKSSKHHTNNIKNNSSNIDSTTQNDDDNSKEKWTSEAVYYRLAELENENENLHSSISTVINSSRLCLESSIEGLKDDFNSRIMNLSTQLENLFENNSTDNTVRTRKYVTNDGGYPR